MFTFGYSLLLLVRLFERGGILTILHETQFYYNSTYLRLRV